MYIITPTSNLTSEQMSIFAQGANYLIYEKESGEGSQIGIWTEHTPIHEGSPVVTIGACELAGQNADHFLRDCVKQVKGAHPDKSIIGPMNGNTWMKHRLIIETSEHKPFRMEPIEPIEFLDIFQSAGFSILSRYSSSEIDLGIEQRDFTKIAQLVERKDITIRSIDMKNFENELNDIYQLSLNAFSENFLYTPLAREVFMHAYLKAKALVDPDMVLLAYRNDRLVGFVFCMPDEDPQTVIVKTLATCPEERTAGLGTLLVARAQEAAKAKGFTKAIHALQYESNSSLRISQRFKAEKFRTYGLMHA